MQGYYKFATRVGVFTIRLKAGRWVVFFEDEDLGGYKTPQQAVDDLAGGHTASASCGDTSGLGVPSDIGDWHLVRS